MVTSRRRSLAERTGVKEDWSLMSIIRSSLVKLCSTDKIYNLFTGMTKIGVSPWAAKWITSRWTDYTTARDRSLGNVSVWRGPSTVTNQSVRQSRAQSRSDVWSHLTRISIKYKTTRARQKHPSPCNHKETNIRSKSWVRLHANPYQTESSLSRCIVDKLSLLISTLI